MKQQSQTKAQANKKKNKRLFRLLGTIGALLLLVAGLIVVTVLNPDDKSSQNTAQSSPDTAETIAKMSVKDINSIAYTHNGETIEIARNEAASWRYRQDEDFPLDQTTVNKMASAIAGIKAKRKITENTAEFSAYGLDTPALTITVGGAEGRSVTYNIGMQNPTTSDYYINVEGESAVYTIDSTIPGYFSKGLYELIEIPELPEIDATKVSRIELAKADGSVAFYYVQGGSSTAYTDSYEWFINKNNTVTPADTAKVKSLIASATGLAIDSCADYSADDAELEKYGLKEPDVLKIDYTVEMNKYGGNVPEEKKNEKLIIPSSLVLKLGADDQNGFTYVLLEDSDIVYLMDSDDVNELRDIDVSDYLPDDICLIKLDTVDGMRINAEGTTYEIEISRKETTDASGDASSDAEYKLDGVQIDAADFEAFYDALTALQSEATADSVPDAQPYMSIEFIRNTPNHKNMVLEFIPYDASFYLAKFNGRSDQLVNKRDIQSLLDMLENLK